ncbi:DUF4288 domain-containing protein [Candidatus Sumerlaeota bacterium]|nr:DUF4288 domain-containing protein [Candidatus Sumerlaeota bacterium]MBI3735611.1 DUF4288 domain-containing protein [Candidatus Sumerlaeota bacterium]
MKQFYSAKLLLQYIVEGEKTKKSLTEQSISHFPALSPKAAITHAKKRGKARETRYVAKDGSRVRLKFVGIIDMLVKGSICAEDEVWYDIATIDVSKKPPLPMKELLERCR